MSTALSTGTHSLQSTPEHGEQQTLISSQQDAYVYQTKEDLDDVYEDLTCLNKLDHHDKQYSSKIYTIEYRCVCEILLLIPTFIFSIFGVPIMIIIYGIVFHSILYGINALCCITLNVLIKRVINRQRPRVPAKEIAFASSFIYVLTHCIMSKKNASSSSMPSGDTVQAAVFAVTMIYTMNYHFTSTYSYLWWLVLSIIPMVGFARVYFAQHYIGDGIMGAIEGICVATLICFTVGPHSFF
eukprot:605141_1